MPFEFKMVPMTHTWNMVRSKTDNFDNSLCFNNKFDYVLKPNMTKRIQQPQWALKNLALEIQKKYNTLRTKSQFQYLLSHLLACLTLHFQHTLLPRCYDVDVVTIQMCHTWSICTPFACILAYVCSFITYFSSIWIHSYWKLFTLPSNLWKKSGICI